MSKFLLIILIFFIIILIKPKKYIFETLEVENSTTREWSDPNEICLKRNSLNCQKSLDCTWNNHLDSCINKKIINNEVDIENVCNIYNNKYLDSEPNYKKQLCKKIGCKFIEFDKGTKCIANFYDNQLEHCSNIFDNYDCIKKKGCDWNMNLNKCIPNELNPNDFCKELNSQKFLKDNLCKKEVEKNRINCYVEIKRDENRRIIPFTGFNEFKKRKCDEIGCKSVNILNNNQNLCVSKDFKTEEEVCLNYHQGENVSYSKCKNIGCNYYPGLNKKYNGLCYSKKLSDKFDNQISSSILCESAKNSETCINIGCNFEDNKCKN